MFHVEHSDCGSGFLAWGQTHQGLQFNDLPNDNIMRHQRKIEGRRRSGIAIPDFAARTTKDVSRETYQNPPTA